MKFLNAITLFAIAATASPLAANEVPVEGAIVAREPARSPALDHIAVIKAEIEAIVASGDFKNIRIYSRSEDLSARQTSLEDLLDTLLALLSGLLNGGDDGGRRNVYARQTSVETLLDTILALLSSLLNGGRT
ncbi:hypothetical protein HJFPF1_06060 [Paramyrothecium foliicola]|nr:hypothetical protein HJFPF1_06060 [Paramyrothecium foliicola]